MNIPDDLVIKMTNEGDDLSRRVLEALAREEVKAGRWTEADAQRLLDR